MHKWTGWAVILCALGACGDKKDPIELTIRGLPGDGTELQMFDSRPGVSWNYRVYWKAPGTEKTVDVEARLKDPAPKGVRVLLKGKTRLHIGSSDYFTLVVAVPDELGPFGGEIEIFTKDMPDWNRVFPFRGEIVDKPRPGRYIRARPSGINLGKLRPGATAPFVTSLKNTGDEDITVKDWNISDSKIVKVRGLRPNQVIIPGAELQLSGVVHVPKLAIRLRERIRIVTDATNYPEGIDITLVAEVDPDFAANPRSLDVRTDYPIRETPYPVVIRARDGMEPFVIASVSGHERHFTLGEPAKDPAKSHRLVFRLRRNAPTDLLEMQKFSVRFRVEPQGVDVVWPVSMRLLPPIHPKPARLSFGKVRMDQPRKIEVMLQTFANRKFTIKRIYTEARGRFALSKPQGGAGLPWRFVSPAAGVPPGTHRDVIVIETDDPDVPRIRIPAYLELVPPPR